MYKSDDSSQIGKHAFEVAGLGLAPFSFSCITENAFNNGDGTTRAGGSCDFCGTSIRFEFHIISRDGRKSKVGCDCINKTGDAGLIAAYKRSPEFRRRQREQKAAREAAKDAKAAEELAPLLAHHGTAFSARPHPFHLKDRETGAALTLLDYLIWVRDNRGHRAALVRARGLI